MTTLPRRNTTHRVTRPTQYVGAFNRWQLSNLNLGGTADVDIVAYYITSDLSPQAAAVGAPYNGGFALGIQSATVFTAADRQYYETLHDLLTRAGLAEGDQIWDRAQNRIYTLRRWSLQYVPFNWQNGRTDFILWCTDSPTVDTFTTARTPAAGRTSTIPQLPIDVGNSLYKLTDPGRVDDDGITQPQAPNFPTPSSDYEARFRITEVGVIPPDDFQLSVQTVVAPGISRTNARAQAQGILTGPLPQQAQDWTAFYAFGGLTNWQFAEVAAQGINGTEQHAVTFVANLDDV